MSIFDEIRKRDQNIIQDDEKFDVFDLKRENLEELRLMPWLITPEEYEITCPLCRKSFLPMIRSGAVVTCQYCKVSSPIVEPKQGFKWIRFNCCHFVLKVTRDDENAIKNCPKCVNEKIDDQIYKECDFVQPKLIEDKETKLRQKIYEEFIATPWLVMPDQFESESCVWNNCTNKNFVPEPSAKPYCLKCPRCYRLCPAISFTNKRWVFCKFFHVNSVPLSETNCPDCGENGVRDSIVLKVKKRQK